MFTSEHVNLSLSVSAAYYVFSRNGVFTRLLSAPFGQAAIGIIGLCGIIAAGWESPRRGSEGRGDGGILPNYFGGILFNYYLR